MIVKATTDSEAGVMPSEQLLADMGASVIKIESPGGDENRGFRFPARSSRGCG